MQEPWERHESDTAALLGGSVTFCSGRGTEKLDARAPHGSWWRWVASCKSTTGKGIPVTRALLKELMDGAAMQGADARPVLALRLLDESGRHVLHDLIAVTADDWEEDRQRIGRLEDDVHAGMRAVEAWMARESLERRRADRLEERVRELEAELHPLIKSRGGDLGGGPELPADAGEHQPPQRPGPAP